MLKQHDFWYPPSSVAMTVMLCHGVSSRSSSWVVLMTPLMDSISKYTSLSSLCSMKYLNIEEKVWILHEPLHLSNLYIIAVALRAKTARIRVIIWGLVLLYMAGSWNPGNSSVAWCRVRSAMWSIGLLNDRLLKIQSRIQYITQKKFTFKCKMERCRRFINLKEERTFFPAVCN